MYICQEGLARACFHSKYLRNLAGSAQEQSFSFISSLNQGGGVWKNRAPSSVSCQSPLSTWALCFCGKAGALIALTLTLHSRYLLCTFYRVSHSSTRPLSCTEAPNEASTCLGGQRVLGMSKHQEFIQQRLIYNRRLTKCWYDPNLWFPRIEKNVGFIFRYL